MGALIDFRLATNCKKGGFCGGLIASRLLAFHGLAPHARDLQFSIERLDFNSMMLHKFISYGSNWNNLSYELTFCKKSSWRSVNSDRIVNLHAPLLFNLDARNGWPLTENEIDVYLEEHGQHEEEAEDYPIQPSYTEFSYPTPEYDYGPIASSS